ncbi:MAG: DUF1302 domain-containing protein [Gammaproteobacteria bacterium]|nr:DUF1302 domain-containing protein [Gammaproteobacteria bacterium]
MNNKPASGRVHLLRTLGAGFLVSMLLATPAQAIQFEFKDGTITGSWDTTLSWGNAWRVESRDPAIIGIANGGTAFGVNADDGNLNYDTGTISNIFKVVSEVEMVYENIGAFVRGTYFYDTENENGGPRDRTPLSQQALDRVGSDIRLLDAYTWINFDVSDMPAEIRAGQQVLSWGESTFIQNSINTINPIDVSAIRTPGGELREALIPVPMISGNIGLTDALSMEAFYQLRWEPTIPDPTGTYFSGSDIGGPGAEFVMLGFGGVPEGNFLDVRRQTTPRPDDQGQFGINFRYYSEIFGGTDLGFYFVNYHSRLPIASGRTTDFQGYGNAWAVGTGATCLSGGCIPLGVPAGDRDAAIAAAVARGQGEIIGKGGSVDAAVTAELTATATFIVDALLAGAIGAADVPNFVTDSLAEGSGYYTEYPEDIKLYGVSFNTTIGDTALQGEYSFRQDVPLQVDDLEVLFAALAPLDDFGRTVFGTFGQLGDFDVEENIQGYRRLDVSQMQFTATQIYPRRFGADQLVILGEVGFNWVHDMPSKDVLRFDGPGTFISGNADLAATGTVHSPTAVGVIEDASHFADDFSWGYRLVGALRYNSVYKGINLAPSIAWNHDVSGVSPGPGGNFLEDRKAYTLGLTATYQSAWEAQLKFTNFFGAERYNLVNDRDFISLVVKYAF